MFKSIKTQLIISSITSIIFIIYTYINFNISNLKISDMMANLFIFVTLASVFNTGILTQKYAQEKRIIN